jgi:glutathionyl-hydroquinone reductase
VPVLWDKKTHTIVNNESSEIIRMLNREFQAFAANPDLDLYPSRLAAEIDAVNAWIYDGFNNGVYKAGFATKQDVCLCSIVDEMISHAVKMKRIVAAYLNRWIVRSACFLRATIWSGMS